jgi:hypothetical protein
MKPDSGRDKKKKTPFHTRHGKGKKLKGYSQTMCLGGKHYLTKQEVKDGFRLCKSCREKNATFAPNAEGVSVSFRRSAEYRE